MPHNSREEKRRHLDEMLQHGHGMVMVHMDPRREGVQVPPQFAGDPVLRLNLAYGFNLPALDVDEDGIFAMLSFGGHRFGCSMPWDAVFALTMPDEAHAGVVWPEDLPHELRPFFDAVDDAGHRDANLAAVQLGGAIVAGSETSAPAPTRQKRPSLSLVSADEPSREPDADTVDSVGDDVDVAVAEAPSSETPTDASPEVPPQRPMLRLVK